MYGDKILVVGNDAELERVIRSHSQTLNLQVGRVTSIEGSIAKAHEKAPDLIVLDLSGQEGMEMCRELRKHPHTRNIPTILLTEDPEIADGTNGGGSAADTHLTRPFSPDALVTRIKAILRKVKGKCPSEASIVDAGEILVDPVRFLVWAGNCRVDLTLTEFKILHLLAGHPGWVYSRHQIISAVKGDDYPATDRSVDVQIVGIRRKLGRYGDLVQTVRGVGYRFRDRSCGPTTESE